MTTIRKPNFSSAYTKANEILVSSRVISTFPFSPKDLVKEKSAIPCRTFAKARSYGVDIEAFGSESAIIMELGGRRIIFYDESKPLTHVKYSILHELGHDQNGHDLGTTDPDTYPFDSGAYENELYKNFLHRRMNIKEFEIPSNIESIQKYITTFFGNNQQYIDGQALPLNDTGNRYVDALISLLAVRGGEKFDERAHTIEVICNESLCLKDVVKCIVLPINLLRDETVLQYLKDNDIEYITYKVKPLVHPTKYYGVISEKVEEYIVSHKEVC
ncbi:MAG: hypothetical protein E7645_06310 [Ruminococcaceae bacterium]|nr:hypothetical protein [Oscillospiraceae bacterium]